MRGRRKGGTEIRTWSGASSRSGAIQREIHRKDIDAGLTEQTQGAALDVLVDDLAHAVLGQVAGLGDARDLEQGGLRRDVWVEAAARGGHEIDRHLRGGVFLF